MKNLFFVLFLSVSGFGFAQETKITGSVLDGEFKNEPLAFAKVSVKNTNQVIDTDLLGKFELNVNPGTYTLVYEFLGYESVEVTDVNVKNKNTHLKEVILRAKKMYSESNIASKGK